MYYYTLYVYNILCTNTLHTLNLLYLSDYKSNRYNCRRHRVDFQVTAIKMLSTGIQFGNYRQPVKL